MCVDRVLVKADKTLLHICLYVIFTIQNANKLLLLSIIINHSQSIEKNCVFVFLLSNLRFSRILKKKVTLLTMLEVNDKKYQAENKKKRIIICTVCQFCEPNKYINNLKTFFV